MGIAQSDQNVRRRVDAEGGHLCERTRSSQAPPLNSASVDRKSSGALLSFQQLFSRFLVHMHAVQKCGVVPTHSLFITITLYDL